jgi:hypothetical protein
MAKVKVYCYFPEVRNIFTVEITSESYTVLELQYKVRSYLELIYHKLRYLLPK